MPIKETAKYRILSNAIQRSFGVSSLVKYPTYYIKANIISDNEIVFNCQMTINFGNQNIFQEMRRKYIEECIQLISKSMKKIEAEYKKLIEEKSKLIEPKKEPYEKPPPSSISLELLPNTIQDNLEYINYTIYNTQKNAFFRVTVLAKIK
jgi:hypothetical protein